MCRSNTAAPLLSHDVIDGSTLTSLWKIYNQAGPQARISDFYIALFIGNHGVVRILHIFSIT